MRKHTKKLIALLLILSFALLTVGCNNAPTNTDKQNGQSGDLSGEPNSGTQLPGDTDNSDYDPTISKEITYDLDLELTRNPLEARYYSCYGAADKLFQGKATVQASYGEYPVVSIWMGSFAGCKSLTEVTVESGVRYVYKQSFTFCTGLTKVTLPATIESIGMEAFAGCLALTEIVFEGTKAQWEAIEKGEDWAKGVEKCTVRCQNGDIELTAPAEQ